MACFILPGPFVLFAVHDFETLSGAGIKFGKKPCGYLK
jgi:hypothetical protein